MERWRRTWQRGVVADELSCDAITKDFRVWQRKRGHRYSIDDVLTAWVAAEARPTARRVCDLGTGLGSVLHMVAWRLPDAHFGAVEAQAVSFALAKRNVAHNHLCARAHLVHGDLRDPATRAQLEGPFELITGTPPYMRPGTSTPSPDSQRAHARVELRGGVEEYLVAAAELLAPGGRAVVCCDARTPERAIDGAARAGLRALRRLDAVPRAGHKGALFSVWTFGLGPEHAGTEVEHDPDFVARDEHGQRTDAYFDLRAYFGLPRTYG